MSQSKDINILAISGSLREKSYNTALLRSAQDVAPANMAISYYDAMGSLPHFDPLLVESQMPAEVMDLREQLQAADGVIISTPEYAYGVSGVLKNALDWVVASGELVLKPVVVTSVSTSELGGARAHYALVTVLHAMNANVLVEASMNVPFARSKFNTGGILEDALTKQALGTSLRVSEEGIGKL
jgi:chromate reductase